MVRINTERGCVRIEFEDNYLPGELMPRLEKIAETVSGIAMCSDIMREGDRYCVCIRHRETLKSYTEQNIFTLKNFAVILDKVKNMITELSEAHVSVYDCVWDVDSMFVGASLNDISIVCLPGISDVTPDTVPTRISDMIAILSLNIYTENDRENQVISDGIESLSSWENSFVRNGLNAEKAFDEFIMNIDSVLRGGIRLFRPEKKKKPVRVKRPEIELSGTGKIRKMVLKFRDGDEKHEFQIGRGAQDGDIPFPCIAGKQAVIFYENGSWYLRDLGSLNGTFYSGKRLARGEKVRLDEGGEMWLATEKICFRVRRLAG